MNLRTAVVLIGGLALGIVLASHYAFARIGTVSGNGSENLSRPCAFASGAAEEITATTAASDASGALETPSRYWLRCDQDAYVRWCTSASCTAASGDFKLNANTIYPFLSGNFNQGETITHMAARNISVTGSCWLIECR